MALQYMTAENKLGRNLFHLLFLLCFIVQSSAQTYNKIEFTEALSILENTFSVKFSFNSALAKRLQVEPPSLNQTLEVTLNKYSSDYQVTFQNIDERYIAVTFPVMNVSICATIIDTKTGTPVKNTTIFSTTSQFEADEGGTFSIAEIEQTETLQIYNDDIFLLSISVLEILEKNKDCPPIFVSTDINYLSTVTLQSYLVRGISKNTEGSIKIKNRDFEILPSLVEPDVLQIAQALPGVESYDETASNINVRGGATDELLILWNDIRMYQTGHFFGLISAFNPNLIDNVIIYKNGTHPRYNEGVSGLLNMQSLSDITEEVDGGVGVNLSSVNLFARMPLSESFAIDVSGRTSINSGVGNPIYKSFFQRTFQNTEVTNLSTNTSFGIRNTNQNFNFYDISIGAIWDISKKDKLRYNFMTINNKLAFTERLIAVDSSTATFNELRQRTLVGGFDYDRTWNSKLKTRVLYSASTYVFDGENRENEFLTEATQRTEVRERQARFDATYKINSTLNLQGGYQYTDTEIRNNQVTAGSSIPISNAVNSITNAYYLNGILNLFNKKTVVTLGGRLTNFSNLENQIEPRININHQLQKQWNIFLAAEEKSQHILQFIARENQLLGIESKQWAIANGEDVPLLKSQQISMGTDYTINGYTLSAEGFYKTVDGINTKNLGFRNQLQDANAVGSYNAKGVEISVAKSTERFTSSLSYSYLDNMYEFNELSPRNFRSNFDVTHTASFAATYKWQNFKLAAGANYHSGLPFTTPLSTNAIIEVDGEPQIEYNAPNNATLDPYFRANVSALYDFKIDETFRGKVNLALLNIFDTKNALDSYFEIATDANGNNIINRVDQFSLGFTPNISFQLFF
ncbi:MAG: TonB-dependent receptor plug domain-containing protein [Patiriisocius sp.]|uniref:TonB-dependent receptor plug domain-containing protein n=1 Tax=Patiriisocius sp. TaxID=2822396 RepID=UPI003EF8FE2E